MAEKTVESTRPRMTSRLSTLASMSEDDFVELVWENDQILMRGRSGRTLKGHSCTGYALYPSNAQAENGGNMQRKRTRLETIYSTLNDPTLLGLLGRRDSDLNFTDTNPSRTGYHLESSPDLCQLNLEDNKSKSDDKNSTHCQVVLEPDNANFRPSNASKFVGWIPELATARNCHLESSSLQCQASDIHLGPRLNPSKTLVSMGGLHTSTLQEHDSHPDKKTGTVNFPYLRPEALLKANSQTSGVTRPKSSPVLARVQESKSSNDERPPLGSRNPVKSTVIEPASGSKGVTGLQNQPEAELIPPVAKTQESLPHEHSEAFGHRNHKSHDQPLGQTSSLAANTPKGKPDIKKLTKPSVTSSSVCSLGASNNPTYSLTRTYEENEESAYPSEVIRRNVEEPQGLTKQGPARRCGGEKRSRTAVVHNLSERRRRDKINEKMRVLKELIPNCNKVDKASMLDEAIEYLKTLQLQLQIMSMGNGVCMPPMMMLPTVMQHFNAPHLTHFSPMGAGMGMGMGFSPAHFPTSQVGATSALPGITGSNFQMLGFPGQAFPMPVSHASFNPLLGRPSTQSVLAPGISGVSGSPLAGHLGSAPLTSSENSIQNINSENINYPNIESSKIQASRYEHSPAFPLKLKRSIWRGKANEFNCYNT